LPHICQVTGFTHYPGDAVLAAANTLVGKIPVNLGRTLDAMAGGMKGLEASAKLYPFSVISATDSLLNSLL
jgi:hypothetical protein